MKDCIATVGTFDGLHLGHFYTLSQLINQAKKRGVQSRVITFSNHPLSVVAPEKSAGWLASRADVEKGILGYGVDNVTFLDFTPELASLTAEQFMQMINKTYGVKALLMGFNNSLGSDRLSSAEAYVKAGAAAGIEVTFANELSNLAISSSIIRNNLRDGQCGVFTEATGRLFSLNGTIARGRQIGRTIGLPTLNLALNANQFIPKAGVYAGMVNLQGHDNAYKAVINIGTNPTVADNGQISIEAFVPNIDLGDCYGLNAEFSFLYFMRAETKFESIEQLKSAIRHDADIAMEILPQLITTAHKQAALFQTQIQSWQ